MQNIGDKIVYNTIEEIINPSHTALVGWDVQNMLINRVFNKNDFAKNIKSVVGPSRKSNVPIFLQESKDYHCNLNHLQEFILLVNWDLIVWSNLPMRN